MGGEKNCSTFFSKKRLLFYLFRDFFKGENGGTLGAPGGAFFCFLTFSHFLKKPKLQRGGKGFFFNTNPIIFAGTFFSDLGRPWGEFWGAFFRDPNFFFEKFFSKGHWRDSYKPHPA